VSKGERKEVLVEVVVGDYRYTLPREMSELDEFVMKFVKTVNDLDINYAVVSGYVAILFGRSRLSEDIDILVEKMNYGEFLKLWNSLSEDFWCIITDDPENAYKRYLLSNTAIRFALKDEVIPNIKIKFPKTEMEEWVIENTIEAMVGNERIKVSNIEAQIAFKLYLGSEKDIEDAIHLYSLFKEGLNEKLLQKFINALNMEHVARRYLYGAA